MRSITRVALCLFFASPLAIALAPGCSGETGSSGTSSTQSGSGGSSTGTNSGGSTGTGGTGNTGGGSGTGAGTATGVGGGPTTVATCQGKVYACGDLIDNDGDGLIDSQDPDCLGPCDNTEDSYYGGIPGQNNAPCKSDCYFDQDTGSGNDDCYWSHKCDPLETAPDYYPETQSGANCAYNPNAQISGTSKSCDQLNLGQSQGCYDYCGPLTPNGCDCFGCCELPAGGGNYVWLGSLDTNGNPSCDIANVNDPTKCHPCTPVQACLNTCGKCELCIGKDTLPPECFPPDGGTGTGGSAPDGGIEQQCPTGVQPCGLPGQAPCAPGSYCITGCCQIAPQ